MKRVARRSLTAIVAIVMALVTLSACGGGSSNKSAGEGVTVGTVQSWGGFNPYVPDQGTSVGIAVGQAIYPSAFNVQADQTATLNEDLLESAELTSTDPQVVTYKIRDEATWSDGTPITADDFSYLWQHLNGSNKDLLVTAAIGYKQIADVAADGDPKTVKVTFSSPFADWRSLFSMLMPAHFMASLGDDVTAWNTGTVSEAGPSGGPYQVAENKADEYLTLRTNPRWYGDEPSIGTVTVRLFGDDQAMVQAVASGEIDYTFDLKATKALIGQVKAVGGVRTEIVPTTNQQFLNTQIGPSSVVSDLPVRQAIATFIQPEEIAKVVFGDDVAHLMTGNHIYAPSSPAYRDNRPDGFASGDADAATAILEDAGYTLGTDGVYAKGGKRLALKYVVRAEDQYANQIAVIVQDQLKKIGMDAQITPIATADWNPTVSRGDFDLGLGNYPASAFPVSWYGGLYPCEAGYNFAKYCSKQVDSLYYQAYAELDPEKQAGLVNQVDELLWQDLANIPMWEAPQLVVQRDGIEGVRVELPKEYQLLDISHWSLG